MNKPSGLPIERLNNGLPILAPTELWWETGVTFNAAAVFVERSPSNDRIIQSLLPMYRLEDAGLRDGIVAIHYRARPEVDPGSNFGRSFIGLAVFTPDLRLLYRYREPVILPSADPDGFDALGVEDPRITWLDGRFYMVYCGVQPVSTRGWKANLCLAVSDDLLRWEKLGIMPGDTALHNNKDGVLFPQQVDGKYYLLHRPFAEGWAQAEYTIHLAESTGLHGPWKDLGSVLRAYPNTQMKSSWAGAGSIPIPTGDRRFLEIYHTGNYLNEKDREYDLDAALFDFQNFDPAHPEKVVTKRIEPLMVPETTAELRSHSQLQVGNVLFACGTYVYKDWLFVIYGGADTYTLAARMRLETLLSALEKSRLENPFS